MEKAGRSRDEMLVTAKAIVAGMNPPETEAFAIKKVDAAISYMKRQRDKGKSGKRKAEATASNGAPPDADRPPQKYHMTDVGNGERFAAQHSEIARYSHPEKSWYIWDGMRWKRDAMGEAVVLAKKTARSIYAEAMLEIDDERRKKIGTHAASSESAVKQAAMLKMAQSEPGIATRPESFDADPMLLNVLNGTIDLKTGELREHDRENMITRMIPVEYDPDAMCPRWQEFLEMVTGGDQDLIDFLYKAVGYALTGNTQEQCILILWGAGQNGKSTFIDVLLALLADYAASAQFSSLTEKKGDEPVRNDIARLAGKRLVTTIEGNHGAKLDEGLVKQLTGSDRITARFLHQEHFEFTPEFKIFLATNHIPQIQGQDLAIWRRIRLVPFTVTVAPENRIFDYWKLLIREEAQGILTWAVMGCLDWQKHGLKAPKKVSDATSEYREDQDPLREFFADCIDLLPAGKVTHNTLYNAFSAFNKSINVKKFMGTKNFARSVAERGENTKES
jgi:putative DNA primase/helicase